MRTIALLAVASLTTGCLSNTYRISPAELQRVAMTSPEERGRAVRVVQRTSFSDDPPQQGMEALPPAQCYDCGPNVWIGVHGHIGPVPHHHHHVAAASRPVTVAPASSGPAPMRATPPGTSPGAARPLRATPPSGSSGGGGGGGGSKLSNLDVKGDKAAAVIVVVAAAAFTVGMIATEGARYDGWVGLAPDQPIHLRYVNDQYWTVPLHALEPGMLAGVEEGVLVENEYRAMTPLGRAPLDRVGFLWRMEGGGYQLGVSTVDGTSLPMGGGANIGLGYFPHQKVGLVGTLALGGGTHRGGDVFTARYGIELDGMPLKAGPFHLGLYGWLGQSYTSMDGGDLLSVARTRGAFAGGALAEIELTTRLALSLRGGALMELSGPLKSDPMWQVSAGFSIY